VTVADAGPQERGNSGRHLGRYWAWSFHARHDGTVDAR